MTEPRIAVSFQEIASRHERESDSPLQWVVLALFWLAVGLAGLIVTNGVQEIVSAVKAEEATGAGSEFNTTYAFSANDEVYGNVYYPALAVLAAIVIALQVGVRGMQEQLIWNYSADQRMLHREKSISRHVYPCKHGNLGSKKINKEFDVNIRRINKIQSMVRIMLLLIPVILYWLSAIVVEKDRIIAQFDLSAIILVAVYWAYGFYGSKNLLHGASLDLRRLRLERDYNGVHDHNMTSGGRKELFSEFMALVKARVSMNITISALWFMFKRLLLLWAIVLAIFLGHSLRGNLDSVLRCALIIAISVTVTIVFSLSLALMSADMFNAYIRQGYIDFSSIRSGILYTRYMKRSPERLSVAFWNWIQLAFVWHPARAMWDEIYDWICRQWRSWRRAFRLVEVDLVVLSVLYFTFLFAMNLGLVLVFVAHAGYSSLAVRFMVVAGICIGWLWSYRRVWKLCWSRIYSAFAK